MVAPTSMPKGETMNYSKADQMRAAQVALKCAELRRRGYPSSADAIVALVERGELEMAESQIDHAMQWSDR